jgi:hypothetical protein
VGAADSRTEQWQREFLAHTGGLTERIGMLLPPDADGLTVLDKPVPRPYWGPNDRPATIDDAIAHLMHRTRPGEHLNLAQMLTVVLALEALCQPTAAAFPTVHEHSAEAATALLAVRVRLRPFNDGSRHRHPVSPPVAQAAIRLRDALAGGEGKVPDEVKASIAAATQRLPLICRNLAGIAEAWSKRGAMFAPAVDLPVREDRVRERLAGRVGP